jgi:general secretion pathway protein H
MTVLELMIVLAIIAGLFMLVRTGFRIVTKADLVEDATDMTAILRRTSQLAVENAKVHRVVFNLDTEAYQVEACEGLPTIQRNEQLNVKQQDVKDALERGKQRLQSLSAEAISGGDENDATKRAAALAGKHIADHLCQQAADSLTGDASGRGWLRKLKKDKGVKIKDIYLQHYDDPMTKGQVALYFWPTGRSEKAVIELTDGSEVFSIVVSELTGKIELHDGPLKDVSAHMLKNIMGNKDFKREDSK